MYSSAGFLLDRVLSIELPDAADPAVQAPMPDERESALGRRLDRIAAAEDLVNAIQAAQAHDLAAFAVEQEGADRVAGVGSGLRGRATSTEVALALAIAPQTAASRIGTATMLVEDHPELLARMGSGRVSMGGLRAALERTEVLAPEQRRAVDILLGQDVDDDLLTPGQLGRAAARRSLEVEPDAALLRARKARRRRCVMLGDTIDGTALFSARLRAEEALVLYNGLDCEARGRRRDGDERSLGDLMCDLLIERVAGLAMVPSAVGDSRDTHTAADGDADTDTHTGAGTGADAAPVPFVRTRGVDGLPPWSWTSTPDACPEPDPALWDVDAPDPYPPEHDPHSPTSPSPPGDPPNPPGPHLPMRAEVQVVISLATLLGLDDAPALLRGYGAIPAGIAREIADVSNTLASNTLAATVADAGRAGTHHARAVLRALFCDPIDGRLVAMDAQTRCYLGRLRLFSLWRDQECRLSGARSVEVDHVEEVQDGGPTTAANAQSLAKNPHVVKAHPGVTAEIQHTHDTDDTDDTDDADDLVARLRRNAPSVHWRMPSGRRYVRRPPPALGWGSRPLRVRWPQPAGPSVLERQLASCLAQEPGRGEPGSALSR